MTHELRKTYDLLAERYATRNVPLPEQLIISGNVFLQQLPNGRVLDVGCGHGRDTAWLARRGCRAVGVDLSAGMLRQARAHRLPLAQADMRWLPFRAGTFGGVWCNAALLHLPKRLAPLALGEMRRVLSRQGVLFLSLQEGQGEVWEPTSYGLKLPRFFVRYAADEAVTLLRAAGFSIVHHSKAEQNPRRIWLHFVAEAG